MSEKLHYYGDCRTICDTGVWEVMASDLARLVENGKEITKEEFMELCDVVGDDEINSIKNCSYWYNSEYNVAWAYNDKIDVEFFFGK